MASQYYYQRDGQKCGPVSASRLSELVAAGELKRDDLVWREGMAQWEPASKLKGLFPGDLVPVKAPMVPPTPAVPATPAAGTPMVPAPVAAGAAAAEVVPLTEPVSAGPKPDRFAAFRPVVNRYAIEFGIGVTQLLAAAAGAACLVLLLLSTLMTWETDRSTMLQFADSQSWVGLEHFEGKLVAFLTVAALILAGATMVVRKLLPMALVVSGAVATCSVFLTFSYLHLLNKAQAEEDRVMRGMYRNMGRLEAKTPEEAAEGAKAVEAAMNIGTKYMAGLGLYLAILMALIAAPALVYAGFFKPIPVTVLQKEGVSPFVRQHGVLLAAQALAILLGLGVYMYRY